MSTITWTFNTEEFEDERHLRECLDAPRVLLAVWDFERWLSGLEEEGHVRNQLFECFAEHNVTIPGWE